MDSFKHFFDNKLPDRCEIFSSLKDECISQKYYLHTIDVWIMFKMNTMGDYDDRYLETDILLLCHFLWLDFIEYCGLDLVIILAVLDEIRMQCLR